MSGVDIAGFTAKAWFGGLALDARAIHDEELARARHALAYSKDLIGNDRMRGLRGGPARHGKKQGRRMHEAAAR